MNKRLPDALKQNTLSIAQNHPSEKPEIHLDKRAGNTLVIKMQTDGQIIPIFSS